MTSMKIVLVVLVACFAAVQCQTSDQIQCITREVQGNQNIQTCSLMFAQQSGGNFNVNEFCGLSCIGDFRTLYDTCRISPNPVGVLCNSAGIAVATPLMVATGIILALAALF